MKDFVVHGYIVRPGSLLVIAVYRSRSDYNPGRRWTGEVFVDNLGHTITLTANGGHLTAEDAFGWAKSELDRIEALRRTYYEDHRPRSATQAEGLPGRV